MSLIINADDLGYSKHRDNGIFACFENSSISAASLIVNGPTSEAATERAKKLGLCLGLHLNLTEGSPLTESKELLNEKGQMFYKDSFRLCNISAEAIEKETRAQFEKFKDLTGKYPTHVDGHQHIHVLNGMPEILAPIFKQYGVLSTRIPDENLTEIDWMDPKRKQKYELRLGSYIKARLIYIKHGIRAPECFIGLGLCGLDTNVERISICKKKTFGIVEFMVHPGFEGKQEGIFNDPFDSDPGRFHEYQTLLTIPRPANLVDWSIYHI